MLEKIKHRLKTTAVNIWQWIYPTVSDTAHAKYSDMLGEKVNGEDEYATVSDKEYDGKDWSGKEVNGRRLDCLPKEITKLKDLEKKMEIAYRQSVKAIEWLANLRHARRKDNFIFIGFSVSSSLLIKGFADAPAVNELLFYYCTAVMVLAIYHCWLLLKRAKKPTILYPFTQAPKWMAKTMLKRKHHDYLAACMEVHALDYLQIEQQSEYELKVFDHYFYAFTSTSLLTFIVAFFV